MPIAQIILFGFAITTEVKNTPMGILDLSNDIATRQITERLAASDYFTYARELHNPEDIEKAFQSGDVKLVIVFSENFQNNLIHTGEAAVQVIADATDPNQANTFANYASNIILQWRMETQFTYPALGGGFNSPSSTVVPAQAENFSTVVPAQAENLSTVISTKAGNFSTVVPAQAGTFSTVIPAQVETFSTVVPAQAGINSFKIVPEIKMLYNPQMKGAYNFVPGVMGLVLILICAMMTSISIVREKEIGTMEILLVSPVKPIYIILAKITPYFTLSIINLTTILLLSVFVLGVPISGSLLLLILFSLLFILVGLSLGIMVSNIVKTQVAAMLISAVVMMMPTMLLSGMIFPIESMPKILQWISVIPPNRWYIEGVIKIMIMGVDTQYVLKEFAILGLMAIVLLAVSLKKFNVRIDNR
jgi:ABC-type multidrug transport system permease subunit